MVLYSMTGYGEASQTISDLAVCVAIQALNSRYLDITFNIPKTLKQQTISWRKKLAEKLIRGRVDVSIELRYKDNALPLHISKSAIIACYRHVDAIAAELGTQTDSLGLALELFNTNRQEIVLDTQQSACIEEVFTQALDECVTSRIREGQHLIAQVKVCLTHLGKNLNAITTHAPERKSYLRKRLQDKIQTREGMVDANRWEQEVLYYLEKMDIEEECVRLRSHIDYIQHLIKDEKPIGRRLGFILQEMLREINTISAKAQDVTLQHLGVSIKQSLEQIKEQGYNLL